MHEMMNLLHYVLESGSRLVSWMREGLAEYDGYFHTTEYNRTTAVDSLIQRVDQRERGEIYCCRTLDDHDGISTSSTYYGSAVIMLFLEEQFGEEIHTELFRTPLRELLERNGKTVEETFDDLEEWFNQQIERPGGEDYTPSMACTGRYWYTNSGGISFEVRILNNYQRPASHEVFQQQYRPDAFRPWTTKSSLSLVSGDTSGFSTPLFTSVSSAPFQWRARSCPRSAQTDDVCSNWSNIINWTAASCAARR